MADWTPEPDLRPGVVSPELIGTRYDAALDGEPLLLEWSGKGGFSDQLGGVNAVGYEQQSDPIGIQQTSTSDDIAENKLSPNEFWRSIRDFQGGFDQRRFDVPKISQPNAYRDSWNVDSKRAGELSLCRTAVATAPATFDVGTNGVLGTASEASPQGVWFISQKAVGGPTQAVTLYDLTTFTTKTLNQTNQFYDLTVAPDDTCYIAASNRIFSVTSATAIAAWSTTGFSWEVIRAAKQRLYAFGTPAGGLPGLYEIPTEGTAGSVAPVLKLALSPGVRPADIKEAGGLVLFAVTGGATNGGPGVVYVYDGTAAPYRAVTFEKGEDLLFLQPILGGSVVMIATQRQQSDGTRRYVLYRCSVQGTAMSSVELVHEYGDDYTEGAFGFEAAVLGQRMFFGGQGDLLQATGIGIDAYNYVQGTVAHHLQPPTIATGGTGVVRAISQHNGRIVWFQLQSGAMKVLTESLATYVTVGELTTSAIDLNVDAPKHWTVIEAGCLPLKAGQKIEVYWSADDVGAGDFRLAGMLTPGLTNQSFPLGVISRQLTLKAKLYGTSTTTPTLVKLGVAAQMARLPKLSHNMKIRAYSRMRRLDGSPFERTGKETYIHDLAAHVEAMRHTGRAVWLQSPLSRQDGHADLVKIGRVLKRMFNNPAQGAGGEVSVELSNVLPDRRNLWPLAVTSHSSVPISLAAADLYEQAGGGVVTFTADAALAPWTTGQGSADKFSPTVVSSGVRWPKAHQTTVWDPVLYRGLPISASVIANPYLANLKLTLALEFWDSTDTLRLTVTSKVFTLDHVGTWYPLYVEGVTTDAVASFGLLYVTGKVLVDASSSVGAFALDGAQLEQARIATRWQAPPSTY